ncbi:Eco57I restriction-modification methylase domain-containing protein [Streptomyces arenae]|uniref:Eco57I restriction-modification methylase domain-containing protein n=1 Tax=Streptomyces arenae TaxID=29301 RepID=UPI002657E77F|nr:N-6 DNA methylase [Streptomyces arenae]MCG7205152.1 N-6 DNA methylase [Streptomyces arenae]
MAKAKTIVDERTLAGWLSSPTEARAARLLEEDKEPVFFHADVEEHVQDPETGVTKRCDVTLRSRTHPIATVEMKRPEVAAADSPALQSDSWSKAVGRGLPYFLTANFREILVWETAKGPDQSRPLIRYTLAADLSHSSFAPKRRAEISDNWVKFLDEFAQLLHQREEKQKGPRKLPPQVLELKEVIHEAAEEAAERIRSAVNEDEAFRQKTLEAFRLQFGVEISLNPHGSKDRLLAESLQVATIATFVVTTRLMLYQALANSNRADGTTFALDLLDITRSTGDPQRVLSDLAGLYEHARRKTGDFETQFSPSELDDIVFVDAASSRRDVGELWGKIIDVVQGADWEAPVTYVPGLYESLLDDEHRHVMGVHYTPDPVVELITAYAVQDPADIVLDPASGAGTFVTMCYERKRALGSTHDQSLAEVYAVELAQFAASLTGFNLTLADTSASSAYPRVFRTDFFQTYPGEQSGLELPDAGRVPYPQQVDAVVGNPPYIRFESRLPEERQEVFNFLQRHFLKTQTAYPNFTGKADIWAFFVAGAHMYLRPGGRLGFIVSWNLLASDYGDAVITFLARYFKIHALIDSRVERWFAAKQNTVIILAEKVADPAAKLSHQSNPNVPADHQVRFVRLKRPIEELVSSEAPRGKRAEDLIDEILATDHDAGDDLRWDIRIFAQKALLEMETSTDGFGDE